MSAPELSVKIRGLRRRLKLTQAGLAEQVGVSQVAVSRWESGQDEPSAAAYSQLARISGPPDCWFFWEKIGIRMSDIYRALPDLEESRYKPPELTIEVLPARGALKQEGELKLKKRPDAVAVPLLHDPAAAGSPRLIEAAAVDRMVIADARDCPHPDATVCISVRGESMSPVLEDGYIVALDTFDTEPKRLVNEMVAARDPDGGVTIKWLRHVGSELMLIAQHTSPRFQPILLNREPGWKVIGRVLWWIGKPRK
jgi:transcriptional regulator with XRE-family HTH domain